MDDMTEDGVSSSEARERGIVVAWMLAVVLILALAAALA